MADGGAYDAGKGRLSLAGGHQKDTAQSRARSEAARTERARGADPEDDLENLPFFLIAGLLFVLTEPSLLLAQWLLYGYVVSRLLHFAAYFTERTHDTRAACWTVGSLILIFMTCWTLVAALAH
jgi:glutathione S-transferase